MFPQHPLRWFRTNEAVRWENATNNGIRPSDPQK